MTPRLLLLVVPTLLLAAPAGAVDKDDPFGTQAACPTAPVAPGATTSVAVEYQVFSEEFFIYRDMSSVTVNEVAGLTAGEAVFPKGKVKFDKVSEQDREIFSHNFRVEVPITVPADAAAGSHVVAFNARLQGCNKPENYCLFPENQDLTCDVVVGGATAAADPDESAGDPAEAPPAVDTPEAVDAPTVADAAIVTPAPAPAARSLGSSDAASDNCAGEAGGSAGVVARVTAWLEGKLAAQSTAGASGPGALFLLLVFLGGVASSLTPCVYPMIPITVSVIGANADQGKAKSFSLACVYVGGIAATYTVLGVAAAGSSGMFGSALQNPWVLGGVGTVLFALALSMFGVYEFGLPSALTNRASMAGGGGGYVGAFVVGTVAGIVAAPCTGPIVLMLLAVIGTNGWGLVPSAVLMLTYSLGLGMLFLAVGTFAGSLPRSGAWMETVKHVFGVILVGATLYYVGQMINVISAGGTELGWADLLMTVAWTVTVIGGAWVVAGEKDVLGENRNLARAVGGVLALGVGLFLLFAPEKEHEAITWSDQYQATLSSAKTEGRPVILDFTADWCAACKELEHKTYTDAAVLQCADEFETVMIDGTTDTPEFVELKKEYGIKGLPAVYFLCPEGDVVKELTLKGFEPADRFLEKMNIALNTCRAEPASTASAG
ncbi:MAG: thioredoxin fold domain-containing protein [Proteobacteria bacterium]|nr:thioredoxin fold domain-containing protein [Pseudomonadota bacterium]